jgi:hypothetical protein
VKTSSAARAVSRHQTGTGDEGVAEFDESKFGRAPEDQIFVETRKMNSEDSQAVEQIGDELAVTYCVDPVLRDAFKSKSFCNGFAIECDG